MIRKHLRWMAAIFMATNLAVVSPGTLLAGPNDRDRNRAGFDPAAAYQTTTRIKQVVVIFQENVSFDHYFATYPIAMNPKGETQFKAKAKTHRQLTALPSARSSSTKQLASNPFAWIRARTTPAT